MRRGLLREKPKWVAGAGTGALMLAMGVFAPVTGASPALADPATEAAQAVIVVLSDQVSDQPADPQHVGARRARTGADQQAVLKRLAGPKPSRVKSYTTVNGFAATVTPAQAEALAADPAVAAVIPDRKVSVAPVQTPADAPAAAGPEASARAATKDGPQAICPSDPNKPLLEPEALQVTRTATTDGSPSAQQLVDGSGVKVAFIADGIDPNNADFIRADGSHVFADYQDFSGEGPNAPSGGAEAFGDASSIAAQGRQTYDLANFVNPAHPLPPGCNIRILGMAPGAALVGLKAGGSLLPNSAILQSIDYAVTVAHVDVINESFGGNVVPDNGTRDTIQLFNQAAVAAGVTVTVSTGDAGITGTIGSPSTNPGVISVGASTTFRLYAQTSYGAAQFSNGHWADDNISALSSGGITQGGRTMDLVAPGEAGWALCSTSPQFDECASFAGQPSPIQPFGGTSQSAPLTAGAAALVIQAYRQAHHGASPSPAQVKQLLTSTAHDLGLPAEEQGAGLLDARAAVEAATTMGNPAAPRQLGSNVLLSPNQVDLTGNPGQAKTVDVAVTNVGTKDQTVTGGTRTFAGLSDKVQTVPVNSTTDPTYIYSNGQTWTYKKFTFQVPAGADRLGVTTAWQGAPKKVGTQVVTPVVRLTLLDPSGTYEGNSRPQGGPASANHAFVDIRRPTAGTWTGILYTVAGPTGYTGPVTVDASTQRAVPDGSVSPPVLRLHPGQTGTLHVHLTTPASGGDAAESITVGSSDGHLTSIPVILRSLVPTSGDRGTFTGTITGGNARAFAPAQSFTYAFDVPAGKRDVGVGLTLAKDPNVVLEGVLVDPDGEPVDVATNATYNADGSVGSGKALQATFAEPVAGRWRFVLIVQNPVSGAELAQDFAGVVAFNRGSAHTAGALTGGRVPAGQATTATVTYTNTGVAPQLLQLDARTDARTDQQLVPQFASATLQLPLTPTSSVPAYLIPPGTDKATLAAASTTPAQVELQAPPGGIDVFGNLDAAQAGHTVSVARVSEKNNHPIAPGYWFTFVQQIGPFTGPAPAGTSTLTATAHTRGFNRDITADAGDPYLSAVDASASPGNPLIVQPGQTVTVPVTITPHGARGTTVSGVLYLVTTPIGEATFNTSGDTLAALAYQYTIK